MGDIGQGGGGVLGAADGADASVTGVGPPVLLSTQMPEVAPGDLLDGRYQIEALIGTGGSGRVLRAFDRVSRAAVALKILRPEYVADPIWTERFSRELRVGRQIQHRNVCRIFDIGAADGHRFLSMELATRGTVRAQLGAEALRRPLDHRIADARAVVDGAAALHASGIVHRDLKPENLLRMEDGRLVISDFGLATDPGAGPATTIMVGTPRYMAPEVVMGDPATTRSDVWALGVVLHEILFGVRPDVSVVRRGIRRYTPPPVIGKRERRLAELCGRCASDDPRRRPATAGEARGAFESAVLGVRARPTADTKQIAWGAIAFAALLALGVVRDRWASRAAASSSQIAGSAKSLVQTSGAGAADLRMGSRTFATMPGAIDCLSVIDHGRTARVIWGVPRKAEDIEVASGRRKPAGLLAETYAHGCPRLSGDARSLLFERLDPSGSHIYLSPSPDGRAGKELVRGAAPEWHPNNQEFVFQLDARHLALFSIPTGEMTVVSDGIQGSRQLAEKTIDASGTRVAARYFTDTVATQLAVHSLTDFSLLSRFLVSPSARGLHFGPGGEQLLFALDGDQGVTELASANWRNPSSLERVGTVPGRDIQRVVDVASGSLISTRRLTKNLLLQSQDGFLQLTRDGQSDGGSMSVAGDLMIQRRMADGRFVIFHRSPDGIETQITDGPLDMSPAFFPDGRRWLHASYTSHQLIECSLATRRCSPFLSNTQTPVWPAIDPSGQQVAYVTYMNQPRLRLASRAGGKERDLGPCSAECAPFWTTPNRLWVIHSTGQDQAWAEVDTERGARTGRIYSMTAEPGRPCRIPAGLLAIASAARPIRHVSVDVHETSELIFRSGQFTQTDARTAKTDVEHFAKN